MRHLIEIATVWLYLWGWRKHGFRKTNFWACAIIISIYPFAFTGMLLPSVFGFFGIRQISTPVQIAAGVVAMTGAMIAAKYVGWTKVLAGLFMGAMIVSSVVIIGFLFLVMGAAIHATPEALVVIAVLTIVLTAASHGYRARGH
jgi:hypothetical protein